MRRSVGQPLDEAPGALPGCRCSRCTRAGRELGRTGPGGRGEVGRIVPQRKHVFLVGQHPDRMQPRQVHSPGTGETLREPHPEFSLAWRQRNSGHAQRCSYQAAIHTPQIHFQKIPETTSVFMKQKHWARTTRKGHRNQRNILGP